MRLILLTIYFLSTLNSFAYKFTLDLNDGWEFRKVGDEMWQEAAVPGGVHQDLYRLGLIKNPLAKDNEKKLGWIEQAGWEYKKSIKADQDLLNNDYIFLQFDGLDTYAHIFLNGEEIIYAYNMFRKWEVDIKYKLKVGNNMLNIVFEPAVEKANEEVAKLPYTLPEGERVFARKAQYHFGWDWAPRFVTTGIYKDVKLAYGKRGYIQKTTVTQKFLVDSLVVKVKYQAKYFSFTDDTISVNSWFANEEASHYKLVYVKAGTTTEIVDSVLIFKPKLWYCNGKGEPYLYTFILSIQARKKTIDEYRRNYGIRRIEWVTENDSMGQSFYMKLNGSPIFMKGANYVPATSFYPLGSLAKGQSKHELYKQIILNATEANMNMLRVWGGGIYEDDEFYQLCDEYGILVWQDFMFACSMYPGDSAFMNNVKQEALYQVGRLSEHPCLALWCGNNENDEGWKNWGWQKQYHYTESDSIAIWNDYTKLFHEILPSVVKANEQNIYYHASSPKYGWGRKESMTHGDAHYWGVWWGLEPFSKFKEKVPRFMSEYGMQGLPVKSTLDEILYTNGLVDSASLKNHQKHPRGFETINHYMRLYFDTIYKDPEMYAYASQVLQSMALEEAIVSQRSAEPYCMGTLLWQLNDCWPAASWSITDVYGKRKPAWFTVQKLYRDGFVTSLPGWMAKDSAKLEVVALKPNELNFSLSKSLMGVYVQLPSDYYYVWLEGINVVGKYDHRNVYRIEGNEVITQKMMKKFKIYATRLK